MCSVVNSLEGESFYLNCYIIQHDNVLIDNEDENKRNEEHYKKK